MTDLYNQLKTLPKIELHRHLEGSIPVDLIEEIALQKHIKLFEDEITQAKIRKTAQVTKQMKTLKEVLDCFSLVQKLFVSGDVVKQITYRVCKECALDNIKLQELRFSPYFISKSAGLGWDKILSSIREGVLQAQKDFDIQVGLLIICSREFGEEITRKTIDFAIEVRDELVGVDLAGNEADWPPELYEKNFKKAYEAGLNITIHAGEAGPPENVITAVSKLKAKRIGHGVQIIHSQHVMDFVKKEGITLELCPTSNYIVGAVNTIEEHPLKKLLDYGIKVTINSDDPELFAIDLTHEYKVCVEKLGFTLEDIQKTLSYAKQASLIKKGNGQLDYKCSDNGRKKEYIIDL